MIIKIIQGADSTNSSIYVILIVQNPGHSV